MLFRSYPGRTQRYTYSEGIKYYTETERPKRVKVRRDILDIYEEYMHADSKIKLMYSEKYAGLSNYWKKFMGEADALKKLNIYERRKDEENQFSAWVKNGNRSQYKDVISSYDQAYVNVRKYGLFSVYMQDGISNSQPMVLAMGMSKLEELLADKAKADDAKKTASDMLGEVDGEFKEFFDPIEKKVLAGGDLNNIIQDADNPTRVLIDCTVQPYYPCNYIRLTLVV